MAGSTLMNAATLTHSDFGKTPEGVAVWIYALKNKGGIEARITNYGGRDGLLEDARPQSELWPILSLDSIR